jgi:hypothetical protein
VGVNYLLVGSGGRRESWEAEVGILDLLVLRKRAGSHHITRCMVQNKYDSSGVSCPGFTPEKHLANITYISDFRVALNFYERHIDHKTQIDLIQEPQRHTKT